MHKIWMSLTVVFILGLAYWAIFHLDNIDELVIKKNNISLHRKPKAAVSHQNN